MNPNTSAVDEEKVFLAKQHILFALRSLKFLPSPYLDQDSNRLSLAYFCLSALSLLPSSAASNINIELSAVDVMLKPKERVDYIAWAYRQQVSSGGFRGSDSMEGTEKDSNLFPLSMPNAIELTAEEEEEFARFDDYNSESDGEEESFLPHSIDVPLSPANMIQSYTAILILGILDDDFKRLNKTALIRFIARCQNDDGSFSQFPGCLEPGDPRSTYSAFAIASMFNDWSGIHIDLALEFLSKCQRPDGGFAINPHLEPQGGMTYCAVASYSLASRLQSIPNSKNLLRWLVDRQVVPPPPPIDSDDEESDADDSTPETSTNINSPEIVVDTHSFRGVAGFQGRSGKDSDACYSFWCTAAIKILEPSRTLLKPELDQRWLHSCQHPIFGGIAREPGAHPDVYHTYLSLAALSVGGHEDLRLLNPEWNVSIEVASRIRSRLSI